MHRMHLLFLSLLLPYITSGHHVFSAFFDNDVLEPLKASLPRFPGQTLMCAFKLEQAKMKFGKLKRLRQIVSKDLGSITS